MGLSHAPDLLGPLMWTTGEEGTVCEAATAMNYLVLVNRAQAGVEECMSSMGKIREIHRAPSGRARFGHSVTESQTLAKHSHKIPTSRETEPGCAWMLGSVTDLSFGECCARSMRHEACVLSSSKAREFQAWDICNIWHIHLSYTRCMHYTHTHTARKALA